MKEAFAVMMLRPRWWHSAFERGEYSGKWTPELEALGINTAGAENKKKRLHSVWNV